MNIYTVNLFGIIAIHVLHPIMFHMLVTYLNIVSENATSANSTCILIDFPHDGRGCEICGPKQLDR